MSNKRNIIFSVAAVGAVLLCAVLLIGYGRHLGEQTMRYHDEQAVIGTYVQVDVCAPRSRRGDVQNVIDQVWQRFQEVEERMNAYDSGSEIGRINTAGGAFVEVHPDVYGLVRLALEMSHKTSGAFDVTVRPLIDLWIEMEEAGRIPTEEEIQEARQRVGVEKIRFSNEGRSAVACDGCAIDLGGIAKGYAVDEATRILSAHGFDNFLIDAGGDMYAGGKNCDGESWRIGVRDPKENDQIVDIVLLSDQAVTTSGDYERFYEIEGERFSHIIDPETGYSQKGVVSATVIAPTAVEADVLSTALCVWGRERGLEFIDQQGAGYAAFIIVGSGVGNAPGSYASDRYALFSKGAPKKTE